MESISSMEQAKNRAEAGEAAEQILRQRNRELELQQLYLDIFREEAHE
jgi:hypothetical protein